MVSEENFLRIFLNWVKFLKIPYDPNTETYAESKFESNPILTLVGEIPI
jgi:hypothetical protein